MLIVIIVNAEMRIWVGFDSWSSSFVNSKLFLFQLWTSLPSFLQDCQLSGIGRRLWIVLDMEVSFSSISAEVTNRCIKKISVKKVYKKAVKKVFRNISQNTDFILIDFF